MDIEINVCKMENDLHALVSTDKILLLSEVRESKTLVGIYTSFTEVGTSAGEKENSPNEAT